ncbi:MAG: hypothetical protein OXF93_23495 [Acidobacteria bacterium]|nr:hypothetical protein [Acidobacteriota bacterium]
MPDMTPQDAGAVATATPYRFSDGDLVEVLGLEGRTFEVEGRSFGATSTHPDMWTYLLKERGGDYAGNTQVAPEPHVRPAMVRIPLQHVLALQVAVDRGADGGSWGDVVDAATDVLTSWSGPGTEERQRRVDETNARIERQNDALRRNG